MTHFKRSAITHRSALLCALLMAQGVAFAAPPSKSNDDASIPTDRGQTTLAWADTASDWGRDNCLEVSTGRTTIKLNCDGMEGRDGEH